MNRLNDVGRDYRNGERLGPLVDNSLGDLISYHSTEQ